MFKTSLIAAAAIASAVSFASTAAKADPHIGIGIGLGFGGGFGGGGIGFYDGGYGGGFDGGYIPHHHHHHMMPVMDFSGISCGTGASIVRSSGFHGVSPYDCSAPVYSYQAWRHGEQFDIRVNVRGNIISVDPAY